MKSLALSLPLAFALCSSVASFTTFAEPSAVASTELSSKVFDWDKLAVKTSPKGESRFVADTKVPTLEKFEMHITTLNPGMESHPPHHHPQEEIILMKEGTVETSINGHKETVEAGSLFFFASHDVHNAKNVGTTPSTYYVINFYTAATAKVKDQPAAEWAPSDKLKSSVIHWDKLVPKASANDSRRYLIDSPTLTFSKLEIHATTVSPGAPASKAHRHPWVQLVIMKEGAMDVTIDGTVHRVGTGSVAYLASNAMQSMKNPGDVPATYYVLSVYTEATPKPSE